MVRAAASLHRHDTGRHSCRELGYSIPVKPPLQDDAARRVQSDHTAAVLAQVDPQYRYLHQTTSYPSGCPASLAPQGRGAGHPINFRELSLDALPASAAGEAIEVWFQDEARVGQKGSLEYI